MADQQPFKDRIKPDSAKLKSAAVPTMMTAMAAGMGGMVGTVTGWHSLYLGALAMYMGQYSQTSQLTAFGAGMFAALPMDLIANGGANLRTSDPDLSLKEKATIRAMAFKDAFAKKMFMDKLFKKKDIPEDESSIDGLLGGSGFDELERLQQSLVASAMDFNASNAPDIATPMLMPGSDYLPDTNDFAPAGDFATVSGIDFDSI